MKANNVNHVFSFLETTPNPEKGVERFLALPQIGIAYDMVWVARHYSCLDDLEYLQHADGHISMGFRTNHWLYTC